MSNNITQITDFVNTQNVNRLIDLYNVFKQNNHFPSLTKSSQFQHCLLITKEK